MMCLSSKLLLEKDVSFKFILYIWFYLLWDSKLYLVTENTAARYVDEMFFLNTIFIYNSKSM